ncbi:acetyl esterase/lipase [Actinomycetospora succinea]|uniref:Acetyl esterase/lipase n=1 Tax=Actinomycetospora succinea TaxID=663603 RepID=A0A4R6ULK0_9PSEU|nr:alpha/beta hydrolase [Actinomycetospora succinea]TDQ47761.1 acetyl esterase/lipase [Actinomycetospora succinea]
MVSAEAEKFADMLRQAPRMAEMPLTAQREAGEHAEDLTATPEGVTYAPVAEDGVTGVWVTGATATSTVLYLFGGGHVITSPASRHKFAGHLALALDARVLLLDYPLAPEHPYPQDVNAAVAAARWLLERQGVPADRLVVVGESSGGGLVLETLLAAARAGLPRPAAAYLMSPWADLTCSAPSFEARRDVDLECSRESLTRMARQYLDGRDPTDPGASPALALPKNVAVAWPPLLVQVGSHEVLLDDALAVTRVAALADVPVTLDVWPQMQHFFQLGVGVYPEAADALARAGEWVRRQLA